jgi:methylphosphotriester-DNA--protein-cysteine methyltransferase
LEQFLLQRISEARARLSIIDEVATFIDEKKGLVTVDQLAEKFKISRRYLEKQFLEKVGVSPKLYSRLKRFVMLSLELAYENNSDWQTLIEKAGLHDQSHLIKEFLEFDKTTPAKYFKTHKEMTRFLKR